MVSGMYIGEVTRNILLHFIDLDLLFSGHSSNILNAHYGFDASFVSAVEGVQSDSDVHHILLTQLEMPEDLIRPDDVTIVRWATRMVADRACALAACAIAAVVLHTGNDKAPGNNEADSGVDVGVDGR